MRGFVGARRLKMGLPIFYVKPEIFERDADVLALEAEDARHLARSLRARVGDVITLCDGSGKVCGATLTSVSPSAAEARIDSCRVIPPERPEITILQAVSSLPRMDDMILRAAETGAARVIPFESPRTPEGAGRKAATRMERWRKIAREGSKVARRPRPLIVDDVQTWPPAIWNDRDLDILLWEDERSRGLADALGSEPKDSLGLIAGPEGGFSAEDVDVLRSKGAVPVTVGDLILRTESAASYAAMLVRYHFGMLGARG